MRVAVESETPNNSSISLFLISSLSKNNFITLSPWPSGSVVSTAAGFFLLTHKIPITIPTTPPAIKYINICIE